MPPNKRNRPALARMRRMLSRPRSIADMQKALQVTERSIYRWLRYLENEGVQLFQRKCPRTRDVLYFIVKD